MLSRDVLAVVDVETHDRDSFANGASNLMRLRFYAGTAVVPEPDEIAERLEATIAQLVQHRSAAEAAHPEAEAARADAEQRLADALAELERLKRER